MNANNVRRLWVEETRGWNVRLFVLRVFTGLLPPFVGGRIRTLLLRWVGVSIGRGTILSDTPQILGGKLPQHRISIGKSCWFNVGCTFDASATISIGDRVAVGQQVLILTHTHMLGDSTQRAGPLEAKPVHIEDGAWLGARCTILPGVTIHKGAVVAAGAVVVDDVSPNTLVGGVPARVLRALTPNLYTNGYNSSTPASDFVDNNDRTND